MIHPPGGISLGTRTMNICRYKSYLVGMIIGSAAASVWIGSIVCWATTLSLFAYTSGFFLGSKNLWRTPMRRKEWEAIAKAMARARRGEVDGRTWAYCLDELETVISMSPSFTSDDLKTFRAIAKGEATKQDHSNA
jgi:hypothetical protein